MICPFCNPFMSKNLVGGWWKLPTNIKGTGKRGIPLGSTCKITNKLTKLLGKKTRCIEYVDSEGNKIVNKQKQYINSIKGKKPIPESLKGYLDISKSATKEYFKIYNRALDEIDNYYNLKLDVVDGAKPKSELENYKQNFKSDIFNTINEIENITKLLTEEQQYIWETDYRKLMKIVQRTYKKIKKGKQPVGRPSRSKETPKKQTTPKKPKGVPETVVKVTNKPIIASFGF